LTKTLNPSLRSELKKMKLKFVFGDRSSCEYKNEWLSKRTNFLKQDFKNVVTWCTAPSQNPGLRPVNVCLENQYHTYILEDLFSTSG
jgi:hypothetical protein